MLFRSNERDFGVENEEERVRSVREAEGVGALMSEEDNVNAIVIIIVVEEPHTIFSPFSYANNILSPNLPHSFFNIIIKY